MVQKKFDISLAEKHFIMHPDAKNKQLYAISNAVTDNQKTMVRKKKAKIKKSTNIPPGDPDPPGKSDKLSADYIEKLIKDGLDDDPKNVQLIGKAVDFFVKVKTDKKAGTKQLLNMEGFLQLAESEVKKTDNK